MATSARQQLGKLGEDVAVTYLTTLGYDILERNWRCPLGELDIIARELNDLVVVEVKTRRNWHYGLPQEAVHWQKYRRLCQLAAHWVSEQDWNPKRIRIDIIAITVGGAESPSIVHIEDEVGW